MLNRDKGLQKIAESKNIDDLSHASASLAVTLDDAGTSPQQTLSLVALAIDFGRLSMCQQGRTDIQVVTVKDPDPDYDGNREHHFYLVGTVAEIQAKFGTMPDRLLEPSRVDGVFDQIVADWDSKYQRVAASNFVSCDTHLCHQVGAKILELIARYPRGQYKLVCVDVPDPEPLLSDATHEEYDRFDKLLELRGLKDTYWVIPEGDDRYDSENVGMLVMPEDGVEVVPESGFYEIAVYWVDEGTKHPAGTWEGDAPTKQAAIERAIEEFEDPQLEAGWDAEILSFSPGGRDDDEQED